MSNAIARQSAARSAGVLRMLAAAMALLLVMSVDADAKRKYSFGSSSGSRAGSSVGSGGAAAAKTGFAYHRMLLASAAVRATKSRLTKIYDLPDSPDTTLPDGRHFDIGRMARTFFGTRLVGYVSPTEYIDLSSDQLQMLLLLVGFNSVAEFEEHLASRPPAEPANEAAATPEPESSTFGSLVMGGGILLLIGFAGFCLVSWRRTRAPAPAPGPVAANRIARVASKPAPAPMRGPRSTLPSPETAPRRAPRVLAVSTTTR